VAGPTVLRNTAGAPPALDARSIRVQFPIFRVPRPKPLSYLDSAATSQKPDAVLEAMDAHPSSSRTARLLRAGRSKIAKKVAEEAVEVVIEAMLNHRDAVVRESADLLYNLAVLWASVDVEPKDVWKEMQRRERLFGIAEKLAKQRSLLKARRKLPPAAAARMRKRG